jgi:hypothetical protein
VRAVIIGLFAAMVTGACLGLTADWISSSGGWDEMHLEAEALRGGLWFAAAFLVAEAVRRRAGFNAMFTVPTTCLLGAALFGSIGYMDDGRFEVAPGRVIMFTVLSVPAMMGVVAIASLAERATRWRTDSSGAH